MRCGSPTLNDDHWHGVLAHRSVPGRFDRGWTVTYGSRRDFPEGQTSQTAAMVCLGLGNPGGMVVSWAGPAELIQIQNRKQAILIL